MARRTRRPAVPGSTVAPLRLRLEPGRRLSDRKHMAEIENLRQHRKRRDAEAHRRKADENATKFGRSKAQRILEATRNEKARATLDRHRIEDEE